jgi:RNA polymerase sigma-70 factor (ECF subfamily)
MQAAIAASPAPTLPALPDFRQIYDANVGFVWAYAARRGIPRAQLDDVVQDVFLAVHQSLASFAGRSSLRAWIAGVVRHVVTGHIRKASPFSHALEATEDAPFLSDVTTAAELLDRKQSAELAHRVLDKLTDRSREAFVMYEVEERSGSEVATALGVSENTVRMRVRTARRSLRLEIRKERAQQVAV